MPPSQTLADDSKLFFRSDREWTLRFASLVCAVPVPMTIWLVSLCPAEGWRDNPFGATLWWLTPMLLILLSLVLPASMFLLHDRYVLRLERTATNSIRVQTFLLWGRRTLEADARDLVVGELEFEEGRWRSMWTPSVDAAFLRARLRSGGQWLFDLQGEMPFGADALSGVLGIGAPKPPRGPGPTRKGR